MCSPSSTPQLTSAPYRCCPLLSRFEHIDRRSCPDMSWAGHSPSKFPLHVWGCGPYMLLWAHPSSHPKWHLDPFRGFCTAYGRGVSLYFTTGCPFSLDAAPLYGESGPHLIHGFLGPPGSTSQTACQSVQPFRRNHDRDRQTDRQTDRPRSPSVTIGRILLRYHDGGNDRMCTNMTGANTFMFCLTGLLYQVPSFRLYQTFQKKEPVVQLKQVFYKEDGAKSTVYKNSSGDEIANVNFYAVRHGSYRNSLK